MRLKKVETGYLPSLRQRLLLYMIGWMMGEVPDVIRTILYRPELFGRPYADVLHDVMRGPSGWSVGERELFAAFVSRQNQCPF